MTEENKPQQYPRRYVPSTDAEFNKDVTRPSWADRSQVPGLDLKTTKKYFLTDSMGNYVLDTDGQPIQVSESLLNIYEMFTQDIRLGNLTPEEVEFCRLYIDVSHDLLQCHFEEPGLVLFERSISVIETSHSRKGWFRELLGTLISKNTQEYYEPKKDFWTGGNRK